MVTVRHADPAGDAGACARIYAPYVDPGPASFEAAPPTTEELARRIARCSASHAWLVATDDDGAMLGYAYGCPHRDREAYSWAADVSVYLDPSAHRRGVGRALYADLLGLLRRQGVRMACAGIALPNEASVGLHEAMGFEPVGVYRRIGWKAGAWRDVGWWQLDLTPGTPDDAEPHPLGPPQRLA